MLFSSVDSRQLALCTCFSSLITHDDVNNATKSFSNQHLFDSRNVSRSWKRFQFGELVHERAIILFARFKWSLLSPARASNCESCLEMLYTWQVLLFSTVQNNGWILENVNRAYECAYHLNMLLALRHSVFWFVENLLYVNEYIEFEYDLNNWTRCCSDKWLREYYI